MSNGRFVTLIFSSLILLGSVTTGISNNDNIKNHQNNNEKTSYVVNSSSEHWGLVKEYSTDSLTVNAVAFSSNSTLLAKVSNGRNIEILPTDDLWDQFGTPNGGNDLQRITILIGHTLDVNALVFSPDGSLLASASDDDTIKIWNTTSWDEILTINSHNNDVNSLAFSPDGTNLASGSEDNTARIFDTSSWEEIQSLSQFNSGVNDVTFSPDGSIFATGSNGIINIWDAESWFPITSMTGHISEVNDLEFSPNGSILASISDNTVRIWDVNDWDEITYINTVRYLADGGGGKSISFSLNGQALVYTWGNYATILNYDDWRQPSGELGRVQCGNSVTSSAFSPDGSLLAIGTNNNELCIYKTPTSVVGPGQYNDWRNTWRSHQIDSLSNYSTNPWTTNAVSFSPSGSHLASGGGGIKIINTSSHAIEAIIGHNSSINSLSYSPNGSLLASGNNDGNVEIWNTVTWENIESLTNHSGDGNLVSSSAFSPNGSLLATSSNDKTVIIWDTNSWEIVQQLTFDVQFSQWAVAFSPDGSLLASTGDGGEIFIWNTSNWSNIQTLVHSNALNPERINSLDFSPDGSYLVSGGGGFDRKVILWNVSNWNSHTLTTKSSGIESVTFSPDSSLIAVVAGEVTIIDTSGNLIQNLYPDAHPQSIDFSPDNSLIALGSDVYGTLSDISLHIWGHDSDEDGFADIIDICEGYDDNIDFDHDEIPDGCDNLVDSDEDGFSDITDRCPGTLRENVIVDLGCSTSQLDLDGDSLCNPWNSNISSSTCTEIDPCPSWFGDECYSPRFWDVERSIEHPGLAGSVRSPHFSPDGSLFAHGPNVWNTSYWTPPQNFQSDYYRISPQSDFSLDGAMFATAPTIWNTSTMKIIQSNIGETSWVLFTPDSRQIVTLIQKNGLSNSYFSLRIIDTTNWTVVEDIDFYDTPHIGIADISISPDGFLYLIGNENPNGYIGQGRDSGIVKIWDITTWSLVSTIYIDVLEDVTTINSYSPDGSLFAFRLNNYDIIILDTSNWTQIKSFSLGEVVNDIAFSPDSSLIVAGTRGGMELIDVSKGEILQNMADAPSVGNLGEVKVVTFSPNGTQIISIENHGVVKIWGNGDDDFDNYTDFMELKCGSDPLNSSSTPPDVDLDYVCDSEDPDIDGDGVINADDEFEYDYNETTDSDADGFGDNGDACPENFGLSITDRKGCIDQDGDGVSDLNDVFWQDPSESSDTDGDGVGNNSDLCPDSRVGARVDSDGCSITDMFTGSSSGMSFSFIGGISLLIIGAIVVAVIVIRRIRRYNIVDDDFDDVDPYDNDNNDTKSNVENIPHDNSWPDVNWQGIWGDDGYEWIEHPEQSDSWFWRDPETDDWVKH